MNKQLANLLLVKLISIYPKKKKKKLISTSAFTIFRILNMHKKIHEIPQNIQLQQEIS